MARVTNQGADYEEDLTDETYDEEGGEETDAKISSIAGIPIKFIVIGGVGMLLTLLIVIVFSMRGKGDDTVVTGDTTTTGAAPQQPAVTGSFTWMTPDGAVFGTSDSTAEWTEIYNNGVSVGTITSGGDLTLTDSSGTSVKAINYGGTVTTPDQSTGGDQSADGSGEDSSPVSSSDTETLRKLGYTGDEIDLAISTGMDIQAMIDAAQQLQDEAAREAINRMSEFLSPEFQHIYNNSIFFMPEQPFIAPQSFETKHSYSGSYIVNADYEKIDTYGYQLWIKVKIANNTYAFMQVVPSRWETLPDTGNIVVRVDYTQYGDSQQGVGFYITGLVEQDVTQITVNPEDSAADLDTILNE